MITIRNSYFAALFAAFLPRLVAMISKNMELLRFEMSEYVTNLNIRRL
jgi:hypothetical protein